MPWIGSAPNKTFQRTDGTRTGDETWTEAKAAAVKVRADAHDLHDQDLADGLSLSWTIDGGTQPTADLPMNAHKFTGVANAAARDQYLSAAQMQDASVIHATTAGTNTITATLAPAITAYATGQLFLAKLGGTNTGAATVNLNGVGAKNVRKGKTGSLAASAGDLGAGRMALFAYDGTNMQDLTAPEFPTGTVMLFAQTSAPTGWTKGSTHNNKALRVVTGTASSGGSSAFTSVFDSRTPAGTVGNTTLTLSQIPSHSHFVFNGDSDPLTGNNLSAATAPVSNAGGAGSAAYNISGSASQCDRGLASPNGSGASHTHTFTGTAMDFDVQYVDVILATKD